MKIKYRVWDEENKKFFTPTYEAYKGKLEDLSLSQKGELCLRTLHGITHESCFPERFKVSQFTGFGDSEVKEIYDGDIITFNLHDYPFLVQFENGAFYLFHIKIKDPNNKPLRWGLLSRVFDADMRQYGKVKVIGNIYENPELLKS